MFSETKKYKKQGHFFYKKGDALKDVSKNVPQKPGVYYIFRLAEGHVDLVYIGVLPVGAIQVDAIHVMAIEELSLQPNWDKKMKDEHIDALDIYWFVTQDEKHQDLPIYVEGLLMQRYFEVHGDVPPWNEDF